MNLLTFVQFESEFFEDLQGQHNKKFMVQSSRAILLLNFHRQTAWMSGTGIAMELFPLRGIYTSLSLIAGNDPASVGSMGAS